MQLPNGSARRPKTYGKKKTGKSYVNSGFEKISTPDIWLDNSATLQNGTPSATSMKSEAVGLRGSLGLSRKTTDEWAEVGQEAMVDKQSSVNQKQSLDRAFQQLSISTKDPNRTPPSQHRSPLSPNSKVVNIQGSPKKRISTAGVKNASVKGEAEAKKIATSTDLIKERGQDGYIEASGISKGTRELDIKRELRPRKNLERTPRGQRKTTNKGLHKTNDDDALVRLQPLLRLSHDEKHRQAPGDFQQWGNELDAFFTVEKIAEASYGEVYRLNCVDLPYESVLKVIPLRPLVESYSKSSKTFHMSPIEDVLAEARTLTRMTVIPGFTNLRDIRVMRGQLPRQFAQAWKRYLRAGVKSYFPDPSKKGSYTKTQLWAIIEMENAGIDLEKFELRNTIQVWDIFWGATMALAKGEELAKFEHRDLHLGNICVRERDIRKESEFSPKLKIGHSNLKITIIDYTLSRVEMEEEVDEKDGERIAYLDLDKDPELFKGEGDYQYDIYRYMRSAVYHVDPLAPFGLNFQPQKCQRWQQFHPITNVLWLHYLLFALKTQLEKNTKRHIRFADNDESSVNSALEKDYEDRLKEMENILDLRKIGRSRKHHHRSCDETDQHEYDEGHSGVGTMETAGTVVAYALHKGWLGKDDVVECD